MAAECYSSVKGLVMRATRLDACGVAQSGPNSFVVSDGFVSVQLSPDVEEGVEYQVRKANGRYCINDRDFSVYSWYNLTAEFCEVDPELFELMSGARLIENWDGTSVGYAVDEDSPERVNFALEVWTQLSGDACLDGVQRYIYWLFHHVVDGRFGDQTIENDAMSFTLEARQKTSGGWGQGPYDVVAQDGSGTAGPLLSPGVLPSELLYTQLTEIAPPEPECGYVDAAA